METDTIAAWTLVQEIPVPPDVNELLVDGEQAVTGSGTSATAGPAATTKDDESSPMSRHIKCHPCPETSRRGRLVAH